jgi:hypothetical protein
LLRYIQTINWSGYQGRLAYAAAAPIAALLALGWRHLTNLFPEASPKNSMVYWVKRSVAALPILGLLLLALASLVQLHVAFARPALFAPPSAWNRVCQETTDGFFMEAVDFPETVLPGDAFTVSLAGYGPGEGTMAGEVALINWDGALLDTAVANLSWASQEIMTNTVNLTVPPDALPAAVRLLYVYDDQTIELGRLKIVPKATVVPTPTFPAAANFGDQIALLGYDVKIETGQLHLTTYWQALQPISIEYTIFVHLLDQEGSLIAQQDAQPQGGRYPTSVWDIGEIVVDETMLSLPADAQPAQIAVGLYQLETLARLPLVGETAVGQTDQLRLQLNK